jgi:chloramphenicol 3-O phosphotransferase
LLSITFPVCREELREASARDETPEIAFVHMTHRTSTPSIGRLVLFNGPPSSGKTSLVDELRNQLSEPWFHLSLDDFRSGIDDRWWLQDDAELFDRVMTGYLASLHAMVAAGLDVMAETVITPGRRRLYETTFAETLMTLVGVMCPLDVATEREGARDDRQRGPIDLDADAYAAVHAGLSYDTEIDTTKEGPVELARAFALQVGEFRSSSFRSHLT